MSRYGAHDEMKEQALSHLKLGGDPMKALAFAILAHAEATLLLEPDVELKVELTGALTVDS